MRAPRLALAIAAVVLSSALAGCDGDAGGEPSQGPSHSASPAASDSPQPTSTPTASPTVQPISIPDDCRAILSDDVLAQLEGVPLNDPSVGGGVQDDGSLLCIWRHPAADTTGLVTEITHMRRGPALDMLNALVDDDGFNCFTPDEGTRCEKTWQNETYPVTDGRTLYWRDGILIDTTYSNLAPSGYTSSIVARLFG